MKISPESRDTERDDKICQTTPNSEVKMYKDWIFLKKSEVGKNGKNSWKFRKTEARKSKGRGAKKVELKESVAETGQQ